MVYPSTEPYDNGMLDVGQGHHVYWEVAGNPSGKPAVVLHGGPGSGASPWWRRFFDPERYRVVLLDQRGCGRSLPHAGDDLQALEHNTTADLIGDLEQLRRALGVERWLLFGASWGSTLGLAYAIAHPEHVSEMVFWAVVTTRARDIDWLTHTMGEIYPQEYDDLHAAAGGASNIPLALNELMRSSEPGVAESAARAWCTWEDRIATLSGPVAPHPRAADVRLLLGWARIVTHYFVPHATLDVVEADAHGAGDDTTGRLVGALDRFAGPSREMVGKSPFGDAPRR